MHFLVLQAQSNRLQAAGSLWQSELTNSTYKTFESGYNLQVPCRSQLPDTCKVFPDTLSVLSSPPRKQPGPQNTLGIAPGFCASYMAENPFLQDEGFGDGDG